MRRRSRPALPRAARLALGGAAALAAALSVALTGAPATAATAGSGTALMTVSGPFGPMLVVGSGKYLGYTVYMITSDQPGSFGCTATVLTLGKGATIACTGKPNSQNAEWPALTTRGAPVAGAGVDAKLLGTVTRPGIGVQVTYAGHPLYLFDQKQGQITGIAFVEPGLPPWHGAWYLLSPNGSPLTWPGLLTEMTIKGSPVVATLISTVAGVKSDPVYSYSGASCTGVCAVYWPPVLTDGTPGVQSPLVEGKVGTVSRGDGTTQVTYDGKPLYYFSRETPIKSVANDGLAFIGGDGSGIKVGGGTFNLVAP